MIEKLFTLLEHELQLINELIALANRQQKALTSYKLVELEQLAPYQEEVLKNLRDAEEFRIKLLTSWLGITRKDVFNLRLSSLEKKFQSEEITEIRKLRTEMKKKLTELININTTNRVLTNKATGSINQIISILTSGTNHVCNVRI